MRCKSHQLSTIQWTISSFLGINSVEDQLLREKLRHLCITVIYTYEEFIVFLLARMAHLGMIDASLGILILLLMQSIIVVIFRALRSESSEKYREPRFLS